MGNSLPEYALIGAAVVIVSIGALAQMSGGLDSIMQQLLNMEQQQIQGAEAATAKQIAAKSSFTAAQASHTLTGSAAAGSLQASAAGPVVQTVGANGTTEALAQSIQDAAQQALADGSISQAQYDIIMQVANAGHAIATIQALLENAYQQSNGDATAYANTQIQYNGQTYTPAELNTLLQSTTANFSALKTTASAQVQSNQNLLIVLNNSGAQIINNGYATQQQNASAASFVQYQSSGTTTGSASTNQQSATICTAGQHLDANNQCVN